MAMSQSTALKLWHKSITDNDQQYYGLHLNVYFQDGSPLFLFHLTNVNN